mmetsp:Transcript_7213/g.18344  ORF Transcript_7213/g.18344 Transcript_7213/m.18344 type:complete len:350 (-) Transcript_7213:688-1737(-)
MQGTGQRALQVGNRVDLLGPFIRCADGHHLPVGLAVVDHRQHSEHLDRRNGSSRQLEHADLADVQRIVVALVARVGVDVGGVLPGLREAAVVEREVAALELAQLALLRVLLDRVGRLVGRDLELLARPLGDLAHEVVQLHVLHARQVRRAEGDVVPQRDRLLVLLGGLLNTVLERVLRAVHLGRHRHAPPLIRLEFGQRLHFGLGLVGGELLALGALVGDPLKSVHREGYLAHHARSRAGLDHGRAVLEVELLGLDVALHQRRPRRVRFVDDVHGVGRIHEALVQGELVLRLAVGHLVEAEPLADRVEHARENTVHVVDVVHLVSPRVLRVDAHKLPVRLVVIDHGQHT